MSDKILIDALFPNNIRVAHVQDGELENFNFEVAGNKNVRSNVYLAKVLRENNAGQIFITTHSRDVLVELDSKNLFLMRKDSGQLKQLNEELQGCIRSSPEAFFAKKILVCEGATEIGICRALNEHRIKTSKESATSKGVRFLDGGGAEQINRARKFHELGYSICLFCDSDIDTINKEKTVLSKLGIEIVECEPGKSIEMQILSDLPWEGIVEIINYRINGCDDSLAAITQSIKASVSSLPVNWLDSDSNEVRQQLGKISSKKNWFKRIDHATIVGSICIKYLDQIKDKHLYRQLNQLSNWINNA
jgi:hypothetical protein